VELLLHLLETEDMEEACKKIQADSAGYERVRIWRRLELNREPPIS
jgi:Trm5-related predicted tRNA methylase